MGHAGDSVGKVRAQFMDDPRSYAREVLGGMSGLLVVAARGRYKEVECDVEC